MEAEPLSNSQPCYGFPTMVVSDKIEKNQNIASGLVRERSAKQLPPLSAHRQDLAGRGPLWAPEIHEQEMGTCLWTCSFYNGGLQPFYMPRCFQCISKLSL